MASIATVRLGQRSAAAPLVVRIAKTHHWRPLRASGDERLLGGALGDDFGLLVFHVSSFRGCCLICCFAAVAGTRRHPTAKWFSALVFLCRAVGAPHSRRRRPAPNALVADSVPVESTRSVWTSPSVRTRPAPIAMVFVGPVLMQPVRSIGASASVSARSAMSASGFHHPLLSLLFRGRTPRPRRPSLQYSSLSRQSFTSRGKKCRLCGPSPVRGVHDLEWQRQAFTIFRSVSPPSGDGQREATHGNIDSGPPCGKPKYTILVCRNAGCPVPHSIHDNGAGHPGFQIATRQSRPPAPESDEAFPGSVCGASGRAPQLRGPD